MQELRQFIKNISPQVTDLELDYIVSKFQLKIVDKGKFLIKQFQTCTDFAIVRIGCFKIFYTHQDKKVNAWFAFELTPATEMHSFILQKPTLYSVQALENAEIFTISFHELQQLYQQFNSFQHFGLRLTEQILVKTIDRLTSFQFETAEERYNKILHDKNYTQRLPLKELASFLGITPNSLSRLRSLPTKK
jgi:CRP/FNR family transcriptional regulator, anaerobic regulatory protein